MKLFEQINPDEDDYHDTGEHYTSEKAFNRHAKKPENGAKYAGRNWWLFAESKQKEPIRFKAVTQYTLDIEEKK